MSTEIEMPILFEDSEEPIVVRDRDLILKFPILVRAIESEHPDWQTEECKVAVPLAIPFPKAIGDFLFAYARKYVKPNDDQDNVKIEDYQEANAKQLDELKLILEISNFMECTSFMHSIAFVIAKKLEEKKVEEIAEYFGVACNAEGHMFDERDGWVHPSTEVFDKN
uniref:SKP1-like protein n=1 Tax=Caenorhabditis tropicalis TaxID=1561998 RepID=A0A1I7V3C7_9PELO